MGETFHSNAPAVFIVLDALLRLQLVNVLL